VVRTLSIFSHEIDVARPGQARGIVMLRAAASIIEIPRAEMIPIAARWLAAAAALLVMEVNDVQSRTRF
jgi:hypothetical protein